MGIFKMLFGFSDKCSACGAEVNRGAGFCPQCGVAMPRARVVCPACGQANKASAKFCSQCRTPLMPKPQAEAPTDQRNRWKRLIREAFRTQVVAPVGCDLVVIPRRGARPVARQIRACLPQLVKRAQRKLIRKRG